MTGQQQAFTRVRDRMAMLMQERGMPAYLDGAPPIEAMIGRVVRTMERNRPFDPQLP